MSYTVKDTHHNIVINLDTNEDVTGSLYLRTYVNGSNNIHSPQYPLVNGKFTVHMSDFQVGDVITKFEIYQDSNPRLWQTHEGVQILINGVNMDLPLTDNGTTAFMSI